MWYIQYIVQRGCREVFVLGEEKIGVSRSEINYSLRIENLQLTHISPMGYELCHWQWLLFLNRPYAYDVTEGRPRVLGVKRGTATCVIAKHADRGPTTACHTWRRCYGDVTSMHKVYRKIITIKTLPKTNKKCDQSPGVIIHILYG